MSKAFLGNLTYNQGQEFGVMISDASFDELSKFNDWASNVENGGTTYNGLGTNIKNSFIICAPQSDVSYNLITYTTTTSYIDINNNNVFDKNIDGNLGTVPTRTITPLETMDKGDYDLIVTDHLGNLIRLTPPFADIDTNFFDVIEPDLTLELGDTNKKTNTLYNAKALTFNSTYSKLLNNMSTVITYMNSTYTPILDNIKEYGEDDVNLISNKTTIAYSYTYKTTTGQTGTFWGTFTYDLTDKNQTILDNTGLHYDYDKDETLKELVTYKTTNNYTENVVSWQSLMTSYMKLQDKVKELESQLNPDIEGSVYSKLLKRITELENRPYIYKASDTTPTYIWAGPVDNYNNFITEAKKESLNLDNYIFIHQG